jgi:hypothetical protein
LRDDYLARRSVPRVRDRVVHQAYAADHLSNLGTKKS